LSFAALSGNRRRPQGAETDSAVNGGL